MISLEFLGIFVWSAVIVELMWQQQLVSASELEHHNVGAISAAKVLNQLGYKAHDLEFTTKDGYILNIVKATNPLFTPAHITKSNSSRLYPILFVHGTFMGATTMLGPMEGARPGDFRAKLRHVEKNSAALIKILGDDQSKRSLPLLALNFGYEIWLLNRRGSEKSKKLASRRVRPPRSLVDALVSLPASFNLLADWLKPQLAASKLARAFNLDLLSGKLSLVAGLFSQFWSTMGMGQAIGSSGPVARQIIETLDAEFWASSLDEQITHDLPETVDFVLEQSGAFRVHTVGYSSGGALILLAAAEQPRLAEKVASAVLWSPSVHMDDNSDLDFLAPLLAQSFYVGPVPPAFVRVQMIRFARFACQSELAQRTICSRFLDFFMGYSGLDAPVMPSILNTVMQPVGARELRHLFQMAASSHTTGPCKFKFNTKEKNIQVYGQPGKPPCYNLAHVNLTGISIYVGEYDTLITPSAVKKTVSQLKVGAKLTLVAEPGIHFNHASPLFHDQVGRLLIVPSLLDIERAERMRTKLNPGIDDDDKLGTCLFAQTHALTSNVEDDGFCTLTELPQQMSSRKAE